MSVSWYPLQAGVPLWPCAVAALVVLLAVSLWHERNWRRTLEAYAELRKEAGAPDREDWPSSDYSWLMGVQLWLILLFAGMLSIVTGIIAWAALIWPHQPFGFEVLIRPSDLPYVWALTVAGCAATVGTLAIAWEIWRSPWTQVANKVRRAIYSSDSKRAELFAEALSLDPGVLIADVEEIVESPSNPGVDQSTSF